MASPILPSHICEFVHVRECISPSPKYSNAFVEEKRRSDASRKVEAMEVGHEIALELTEATFSSQQDICRGTCFQ